MESWTHCRMVNNEQLPVWILQRLRAGFTTQDVYWGIPWKLTLGVDGTWERKTMALMQLRLRDRNSPPHNRSRFKLTPIQLLETDLFLLIVIHWPWLYLGTLWVSAQRQASKKSMPQNHLLPVRPGLSSTHSRGTHIPEWYPIDHHDREIGDCWPVCLCSTQ